MATGTKGSGTSTCSRNDTCTVYRISISIRINRSDRAGSDAAREHDRRVDQQPDRAGRQHHADPHVEHVLDLGERLGNPLARGQPRPARGTHRCLGMRPMAARIGKPCATGHARTAAS
jgi:hypothetical protein